MMSWLLQLSWHLFFTCFKGSDSVFKFLIPGGLSIQFQFFIWSSASTVRQFTKEKWLMCSDPTEWPDWLRLPNSIHFLKFFLITFFLISSRGRIFKNNIIKVLHIPQISKTYHLFMLVSLDLGAGTSRVVTLRLLDDQKKFPLRKKIYFIFSLQSHCSSIVQL